jgi:hypothetical protein
MQWTVLSGVQMCTDDAHCKENTAAAYTGGRVLNAGEMCHHRAAERQSHESVQLLPATCAQPSGLEVCRSYVLYLSYGQQHPDRRSESHTVPGRYRLIAVLIQQFRCSTGTYNPSM